MKKFVLASIRLYQKYFSLDTGYLKRFLPGVRVCRFNPTCSEYTYQAVEHYGILSGSFKGAKRIVRCNPWTTGGSDPLIPSEVEGSRTQI